MLCCNCLEPGRQRHFSMRQDQPNWVVVLFSLRARFQKSSCDVVGHGRRAAGTIFQPAIRAGTIKPNVMVRGLPAAAAVGISWSGNGRPMPDWSSAYLVRLPFFVHRARPGLDANMERMEKAGPVCNRHFGTGFSRRITLGLSELSGVFQCRGGRGTRRV